MNMSRIRLRFLFMFPIDFNGYSIIEKEQDQQRFLN